MDRTFAVFPGATRVCRSCALRFNTAACPGCGATPSFDRCDNAGRGWLRERRRGGVESPHRRRNAQLTVSNPPGLDRSPFAALGPLGLAAAANAIAWLATSSPLVAVVAGAAAGVTGAVGLSLSSRERASKKGLCVLDAGGASAHSGPPETSLRGVIRTQGKHRPSTRWAAIGTLQDVAVADLLGPPMVLRTHDGDEYALAVEGATLVVEGPARVRTPSQIRVGRHLHALGWLQGSSREEITAVALHDGVEVEVRGEFDDLTRRALDPAFRSAPRVAEVRPREGVLWLRVLEG